MPTRQEDAAAVGGIQRLQNQKFSVDDKGPRPDAEGRHTWNEMTPDQHIALMKGNLEWKGFDEEQRLVVIENVLAGDRPHQWTYGVKESNAEAVARIERNIDEMKLENEIYLESTRHFVQPDPEDLSTVYDTCATLGPWETLGAEDRVKALDDLDWRNITEEQKKAIVDRELAPVREPAEVDGRASKPYDPAEFARPGEAKEKSRGPER